MSTTDKTAVAIYEEQQRAEWAAQAKKRKAERKAEREGAFLAGLFSLAWGCSCSSAWFGL